MFDGTLEVVMAKKEAIDRFLEEQQKLEDKKQALIKELLEQRKAAVKEFDEQLATLGYGGKVSAKETGTRRCGNCGEIGHNARSCSVPAKKEKK